LNVKPSQPLKLGSKRGSTKKGFPEREAQYIFIWIIALLNLLRENNTFCATQDHCSDGTVIGYNIILMKKKHNSNIYRCNDKKMI